MKQFVIDVDWPDMKRMRYIVRDHKVRTSITRVYLYRSRVYSLVLFDGKNTFKQLKESIGAWAKGAYENPYRIDDPIAADLYRDLTVNHLVRPIWWTCTELSPRHDPGDHDAVRGILKDVLEHDKYDVLKMTPPGIGDADLLKIHGSGLGPWYLLGSTWNPNDIPTGVWVIDCPFAKDLHPKKNRSVVMRQWKHCVRGPSGLNIHSFWCGVCEAESCMKQFWTPYVIDWEDVTAKEIISDYRKSGAFNNQAQLSVITAERNSSGS